MSAVTDTRDSITGPPSRDFLTRLSSSSKPVLDGLSIVSMIAAAVILVAYLVLALQWQNRLFLGAMVTHTLEVVDIKSFSEAGWSGLNSGLEPGDAIIGIRMEEHEQVEWGLAGEHVHEIEEHLEMAALDEVVELIVLPANPATSTLPACTGAVLPEQEGARCASVTLERFPAVDLMVHFGIGYVVGIFLLLLGVLAMWKRFDSQPAQFFAISAAALGVFLAGRLDMMTSLSMLPIWIGSGFVFSAFTISFALMFPYDLGRVRELPNLRYAPQVIGLVAFGIIYAFFDPAGHGAVLLAPIGVVLGAVVLLAGIMRWRRLYSTSPIVREQASLVALGTLVGFGPMVLAVLYFGATQGNILTELIPIVQITAILYGLSVTYAILQYRLMETDRVIPEFIVYNILAVLLIGGYTLVTFGFSALAVEQLQADSPVFIAGTLIIIALLFVPARNYLHQAVDRVMFRQRRNYQERREAFAARLADAVNIEDVLSVIKNELAETVAPASVFLFTYDTKLDIYSALPDPASGEVETDITFQASGGLVSYLKNEQDVLYLEPGQPLPIEVVRDRSQLAVLGTPLLLSLTGRERLNGILCVGSRRSGEPYRYEEMRFVESIADLAATAVERAQFVDDLEERVRIQDALSQVSHALNFAIDFDTLLELIYAQTTRIIDADDMYIVLHDSASDELYFSFYNSGDERLYHLEMKRWIVGRDVISEVVRQQSALRLDNFTAEQIRRDPRHASDFPTLYAWMGVPMITDTVERGVLGVMAIGSSDPNVRFSDEQLQLFRNIANIAASAIDKTQLFQRTRARAAQLKALNDISSRLASELEDVDRLLELITENAVTIMGCEAGSLLLVDENSGDLVFRVVTGGAGEELIGQRISQDGPSLVAEAVKRVEPIIVNNPRQDSRWHGEVADDEEDEEGSALDQGAKATPDLKRTTTEKPVTFQSRELLTLPLIAQGTAVGALQLINKRDGSIFTEEDAQLATAFSGQAAIAIQNARLFESQDKQLLERVEELEGMAAIDHSLNQTVYLDRLVDIIMGWALKQTDVKHGALFIIAPDKINLWMIASYGYPEEGSIFSQPEREERKVFPLETGILGRVINARSASMVADVNADPHYVESLDGCVAQIAVPLVSGAEVTGAIIIETSEEGKLGLLEMGFLTRLADRASTSIANAMLFTQLEDQQKQRADFVRFIAHELNNPLTAMKGYTSLLTRGVVGELTEQQTQFINIVHNNIEHMETLIGDMRDAESPQLQLIMEDVSFQEVLQESLSTVRQAFEAKGQEVEVDVAEDTPAIWADRTRLKQIMINFLTNANKYTDADGKVEVMAEVAENEWDDEGAPQVLHIMVKDNGLGISESDLNRLFEKYFRSTNSKALEQKGTGLGLSLTRRLIEEQGGKIWVESTLGEGTAFHFTVPLAVEVAAERA